MNGGHGESGMVLDAETAIEKPIIIHQMNVLLQGFPMLPFYVSIHDNYSPSPKP